MARVQEKAIVRSVTVHIYNNKNGGNKLRTYRKLKNSYKMEKFLHSDVDKFALSIFVIIRISNSNLNIERGRYIKLPVEKRICPLCNIEPEDEIISF